MGELEGGCIEDPVVVKEDVEVEGARAVGDAVGAVASKLAFDGQEAGEEGLGIEGGFKEGGGVEEGGLVGVADGGGFVIRGDGGEAAEVCEAAEGGIEGLTGRAGGAGEVGAEGEGSKHRDWGLTFVLRLR
jgi:hypothetical protein